MKDKKKIVTRLRIVYEPGMSNATDFMFRTYRKIFGGPNNVDRGKVISKKKRKRRIKVY